MLDRVINGRAADQLLRQGRPVQIVINALRETHSSHASTCTARAIIVSVPVERAIQPVL